MRHNTVRQRVDPVLAPDQFSVARPLRPEDLDRRVTRYGIYPSLPAPKWCPMELICENTQKQVKVSLILY